MLFGLSLLLLVVMVIAFYIKRTFSFWKVRGFPYLKGFYQLLSLDVFLLKTDPSHFFKNIYLNHKNFPYVGIYLFNAPKLIPTDLEIIKNVLVKDFQYFQSRNEVVDPNLDPLFSKSVIMISESKWRFVRNMITPSFTFGKIKAAFGHVDKCGQEMVQYLQRLTKDGSPCLLKDTMNRFTAQTIIGYIMGIEIDNFGESEPPMITYLKRGITLNVKQELTMVLMAAIPKLQQFLRLKFIDDNTSDFFREVVLDTYKQREAKGIFRNDFMQSIIDMRKKGDLVFKEKSKGKTSVDELIRMRFGLITTKIGLIHILSRYEVSPCKDTPIPLVLDTRNFLVSTTNGIPLTFKRIQL